MVRLSKNFSLQEYTKSQTAVRQGIDNNPSEEHLTKAKALFENVIQPVRDKFGVTVINSGYRGPQLNMAVGGSSNSQHCKGEALDLDMDGRDGPTNREVFEFIRKELIFDQLIWEFGDDYNPNWVHVSFSQSINRGNVLKAFKDAYG